MSQQVYSFMPPTLKDILGKDITLAEILTEDKVEACQRVIDEADAQFFSAVLKQIEDWKKLIGSGNASETMMLLHQPVLNVQSQAQLLGCPLVVRICGMIIKMLEAKGIDTKRKALLVLNMFRMLAFLCELGTKNEEEEVAQECLATLNGYLNTLTAD